MVLQERRGMLRLWNVNLVVGTFVLTVLGTFLTRSGIISSVHAFTVGVIGYYFLAFIALVLIAALVMVAGNSDRLRTSGRMDSAASRETVFLLNNLFLTAFMFTVLIGTLFPLIAEAIRGVKVSVGAPFFNRMTLPMIVMLLFLMGVGPALPWRSATAAEMRSKLLPPLVGALLFCIGALVAGARNFYGVVAFTFVGYAAAANLREYWIGLRARRNAHGEGWATALFLLIRSNQRRYGGYLAHLGLLLVALGIVGSSSFRRESEMTMKPGDTLTVAGQTIRLKGVWGRQEVQRSVIGATVEVLKNGRVVGVIEPRMNYYPTSDQPVPTPQVRSTIGGDLYLTLMSFDPNGAHATIRAIVQPLVSWIWFGGGVVVLGALIGLLPARRRPDGSLAEPDVGPVAGAVVAEAAP
jgi:cytochrome c-type biogenesis protein CcmF